MKLRGKIRLSLAEDRVNLKEKFLIAGRTENISSKKKKKSNVPGI